MLQHHDMPLRALLRNMRLLTGLRSQGRQSLLLAGADASQFATNLRKLEPALDVSVVDSESVPMSDALSTHKGKDFGGCLFLQPYHWLKGRSDATMPEWEAARQCLHDEDGTLGLYWVRAAPQPGFVSALATSLSGDVGVTSGLLPPLSKDDTPMTWVDSHITSTTFKPFKHRKFIERLEGTSTAVLPTLRIAHDVRVPLNGPCAVWEQAASHHSKGTHSVMLDLHCFHTTVVPLKKKVGAQHKR